MNNAQRKRAAARRRMDPELYVKMPRRADGLRQVLPLRYLAPDERRDFLARATSPL